MEKNGEIMTKPICKFYMNIYKRMLRWFGSSNPYWLCSMDESHLLKCILRMNMKQNMYIIFINVSCRIRQNNNCSTKVLEEYKIENQPEEKLIKRRAYYDENKERIKIYNQEYNKLKKILLGINLFKKNN